MAPKSGDKGKPSSIPFATKSVTAKGKKPSPTALVTPEDTEKLASGVVEGKTTQHQPAPAKPTPGFCPVPCFSPKTGKKRINLALQGGGAHGAFTWGVIDRLLEDGRLEIDAVSATSAGTMNGLCVAAGLTSGGPEGARMLLETFWQRVSRVGDAFNPVKRLPWEKWICSWNMDFSPSYLFFDAVTRMVSPYQFNPLDINPLRDIVAETIDFDLLKRCNQTRLFISATNVRNNRVKVFETGEITLDVAMASACLPFIFKAVEIEGEAYWDGGYMGNPALFPLFYHSACKDVLIVHINPIEREEIPTTAAHIMNRVNEITFNSSLMKELRAVAFVQRLLEEGWLKEEFRDRLNYILLHSLRADEVMKELSVASKFESDWDFLLHLKHLGQQECSIWLEKNYEHIGHKSTVEVNNEFL
jgi:NTE family protein